MPEKSMVQIIQFDYDDLQTVIKNCLRDAIVEIKSIPTPEELSDRCTFPEACQITGLSRSAIYKKSMDGTIPHEKYGKRLIFSRKELGEWIEHRTIRKQSTEEIATKHLQKVARKRLR